MRKLILTFFFVLFCANVHADVVSETLDGQEALFRRDYPEAVRMFEQVAQKYPESPAGTFGLMATHQIHMYENHDYRFNPEYETAEKRFERVVTKMMQKKPNAFDLFVAGSGYGMRGFYYVRANSWLRGLGSAIRAVQLLKKAKFENPDFVDADLGIGMYNYWRSVLTRGISFLPTFGDHTKEGIAMVQNVMDNGLYARNLAQVNLAIMYGQEDDYPAARKLIDDMLKKYPNNIVMLKFSGRLYSWQKQHDRALAEFRKILALDPDVTIAYYYMGIAALKKPNGAEEARGYFQQFIDSNHVDENRIKAAHKYIAKIDKERAQS